MKYSWWIVWVLAATYAFISLQGIGTIWDCANLLYFTLNTGEPSVAAYRYTDALFGWIVLIVRRFTDNVSLLGASFSLAHLAVTLTAWILSAHLLRRSGDAERLIAALMILIIPLPGQAYVCTDANHVAVLTPILVVLAATPATGRRLALFVVVSAFCFVDHPGSIFVFALLVATLVAKWRIRGNCGSSGERFAFALTVLLLALSATRFAFWLTDYERSEADLAVVSLSFRLGLLGLPGSTVLLAYVAAGAVFMCRRTEARVRTITAWGWLATGALLGAAACIVIWAADPSRWIHGDTYRRFVNVLNVPLGALLATCLLMSRRPTAVAGTTTGRRRLAAALVAIVLFMHTGCLVIQSVNYAQLRARLQRDLAQAQNGLLFLTPSHWAFMTPLRMWALPYNSILVQGRRPIAIASFAPSNETVLDSAGRRIRFSESFDVNIGSVGWFRFDRLLKIDQAARLVRVEGPYTAEQLQDGTSAHWTDRAIRYEFASAAPPHAPAWIRFRYLSATPGRRAQVRVFRGSALLLTEELDMSGADLAARRPGEFVSRSFLAGPGRYVLEIVSKEPGVSLGNGDGRVLSFMTIGNEMVYRDYRGGD